MSDEDRQISKARENELSSNKKLRAVIDGLISQYRSCANIPKDALDKHDLRLLSFKLQKKETEYRIVRDSKKAAKGHAGATLYKEITK